MTRRDSPFAALDAQFERLARLLDEPPARLGVVRPAVSRWSVGQQIDHVLKVLQVTRQVIASERPPLVRRINLAGRLALALNWLPRGVGKAPQAVLPDERSASALGQALAAEQAAWRELAGQRALLARPEAIYPHPYFRGLTRAEAVRFACVHTHHHLKIVDDILAAAR